MKALLSAGFLGLSASTTNLSDILIHGNIISDKAYILLIRNDERIATLSQMAGLPGKYSHIELVIDDKAYSARYGFPTIAVSLDELANHFKGCTYEIRSISFPEHEKAIEWFSAVKWNTPYDLSHNNCVDVVFGMLEKTSCMNSIKPISRQLFLGRNPGLEVYLQSQGLNVTNEQIYLPDHFLDVGKKVESGTIGSYSSHSLFFK